MAPTAAIASPLPTLMSRQQRQQDIPSCARPCLDYFKSTGYSCDSDDLSCFCSQYSSYGFTLGELAYACSHNECDALSNDQNKALYGICSGERDAVTATHSVVALPAIPTTLVSSGTLAPSATPHSTSATGPDEVEATGQQSLPAQGSAEESTTLTTGQAVGVSIGAMGALILAGALIYLLIWCKRRRALKSPKSRNGSFDFIDKGAPRHSPFRHGYADPRGPLGGFSKPRVELDNGGTSPQWYAPQIKGPSNMHSSRHATYSNRSISPQSRSYDSLRTVSQLLPEKAGHTPPQPQWRSPRAASVFSTATIFEEDGKTPRLLSPATMLPMPAAPKPVLRTVPKRPERPVYSALFTTSPVDMRNPQTASSSPSKSVKRDLTPLPLRANHPPPVARNSVAAAGRPLSTEFRVSTHQSLKPPSSVPSSVPSYMPDYYTSDDSRSPKFDMITPPPRRPVPTNPKRNKPLPPPKSYRCSGGSETSFESTDPDEITPPEESDRTLSPVPESATTPSPSSVIRYPKVPRSSNQAVPRSPQPTLSPPYHASSIWPLTEGPDLPPRANNLRTPPPSTPPNNNSSLTGSTLAAKRLGSSAATSLSAGLHIRSSSNPQNSPLKGYGRPANNGSIRGGRPALAPQLRKPSYAGTGYGPDPAVQFTPHTPEMQSPGPKILRTDRDVVLKSPLWEPKLTPSRRGEDLFLSVSLASPGMGPGGQGGGMEMGRR